MPLSAKGQLTVDGGNSPQSQNGHECATITLRHWSSNSPNYIVSMACEQDVSRNRYPKSVAADKGDLYKYPDNREHRENQGDKKNVIEHGCHR
jgi:hypothetical protein